MKEKVMCDMASFQKEVEKWMKLTELSEEYLMKYQYNVEVRYIKADGTFGYGSVADLFFYHGYLFYWTNEDCESKEYYTIDQFKFTGDMELILAFGDVKVFPVLFAGFYTGYKDDRGRKIYTGDVVKTTFLSENSIPSNGGMHRAKGDENDKGTTTIIGVNSFGDRTDDYYYILDNGSVQMRYTKKVIVIGNVFFNINPDVPENIDIMERCMMLARPYKINLRNLHIKMAHAPFFTPRSWRDYAHHFILDEPAYEILDIYLL